MIKNWSHPRKQAARRETLFHPIRPNQHYWSMAGLCESKGCEFTQVLDAGLIVPSQFHGVDHSPEVIARNQLAFPSGNWHLGDFYWTMKRYRGFNPGIVNADLLQTVDTSAQYVAKIMSLLRRFDVTLVVNFVLASRGYRLKDGDYVLSRLSEQQQFRSAMRGDWSYDGSYYEYDGASTRGRTVMGTFIFKHSLEVQQSGIEIRLNNRAA